MKRKSALSKMCSIKRSYRERQDQALLVIDRQWMQRLDRYLRGREPAPGNVANENVVDQHGQVVAGEGEFVLVEPYFFAVLVKMYGKDAAPEVGVDRNKQDRYVERKELKALMQRRYAEADKEIKKYRTTLQSLIYEGRDDNDLEEVDDFLTAIIKRCCYCCILCCCCCCFPARNTSSVANDFAGKMRRWRWNSNVQYEAIQDMEDDFRD